MRTTLGTKRFGRSVGIFLGLVAAALVVLAVAQPAVGADAEPAQRERAVAHVKKLGGTVEVDAREPGEPVVAVDLSQTEAGDADLAVLKGLPGLKRLNLSATAVTDAGLAHLTGLGQLRRLNLFSTAISDAGLKHLEGLDQLRYLYAWGTAVTGEGLSRLRQLKSLALSGEKVTDQTLADLQKIEGLERLLLDYTTVTDAGLAHLRGLKHLKRLHIRSGRITDAGLAHLGELPELELLQIASTPHVTDAAIAKQRRARPELRIETWREGDVSRTIWDDHEAGGRLRPRSRTQPTSPPR